MSASSFEDTTPPANVFSAYCDAPTLKRLGRAIAQLYVDPSEVQLDEARHPLADVYLALLREERGDTAGSDQALARLPKSEYPPSANLVALKTRMGRILGAVREVSDAFSDDACRPSGGPGAEIWCGVFERHPREALAAYAPIYASVADGRSLEQKLYCVQRIGDAARSGLGRQVVRSIHDGLVQAVEGVVPRGPGTMFSSVLAEVEDSLLEPVFMPELALSPSPVQSDSASILASAGDYIRDLDARVARYKRTTRAARSTFAQAICELGRYRHLSLTGEQCTAIAESRAEGALTSWLRSHPYESQFGPNGAIAVQKPWRTR